MATTPDLDLIPPVEAPTETAQIARAASVVFLGNVASRLFGLVRETVKSHYFGAGGVVDAFSVAAIVPTMMYDLLIGGLVNSALVPVFSEYAARGDRDELWRLISAMLSLVVVVMSVFVLVVEVFSHQAAFLLSSGSSPEVLDLAAHLLRITVPAVLFLSLSGVLSGLLYAFKRFSYPAFTAAIFNAGLVAVTLVFHRRLGIGAMALGVLIGAVLQVVLQLPGLRDPRLFGPGARLRFRLALAHPGLRRIVTLYVPIVLGLVVDILISRPISYNLASRTGEGGISWMNYATTLMQLPQGLVATAVSFAILPTLSAHAVQENHNGHDLAPFRATLARGLRLVIVLIVPAAVGLLILASPVVALLFEHGDFGALDTHMTARALQFYLLGLPFAAVDLLLVFAFYARQETLTPALIGLGTTVVYLLTAIALLPRFGLFSLMLADSLKHLLHATISSLILRRRLGGLAQHGVVRTLGLALVAAAVMGGVTYGAWLGLDGALPGGSGLAELLVVGLPGLLGAGSYLALITALRVDEMQHLWGAIKGRLGG